METEQEYQNTLNYLYSFVDYSLTKADRLSQAHFDLERMRHLMQELGNPQQAYPSIHITGTKGKGSVTAMCASALHEGGYRVGMYTSPHLEDYAERIQINGENIPHSVLVTLVEELKPYIERVNGLTTFEITTSLAFLYFARMNVDVAVVEVGLGGRLDATNVIFPIVSVITSISYDHTFVLGNTLAEIAGEKGGIIKEGIPVVSAPQEQEAWEVIQKIALARHSQLISVGKDIRGQKLEQTLDYQRIEITDFFHGSLSQDIKNSQPKRIQIRIPLLGDHQVENATVAYAALDQFRQKSLSVSDEQINRGFSHTIWPGRFEIISHQPPIVLDCAHNRESIQELVKTLQQVFPKYTPVLIFGASEDKDIQGMFADILPIVDEVIATRSFHPRAIAAEKLIEMAKPYQKTVQVNENISQALELALEKIKPHRMILVAGSIFVVAEARHAWLTQSQFDPYRVDTQMYLNT